MARTRRKSSKKRKSGLLTSLAKYVADKASGLVSRAKKKRKAKKAAAPAAKPKPKTKAKAKARAPRASAPKKPA